MSGAKRQQHSPAKASSQHQRADGGHREVAGIDSIHKACAYGDFDALRQFVEEQPALINQLDEQGYTALQWAALNNRVSCCTFLLEHGADVHVADSTQQTALHWAGVRGSLSAAETLLRGGANLHAQDCRGYTVCHVAAQYGQTAFLFHVALRWAADIDSPDVDGRTPLHWAAYKGFADTTRLLLVMDARWSLPDKEGCTPLHWAAIRGNAEVCTLLLQAGSDVLLMAKDNTGSTPSQLAVDKGHRYLGLNLAEYRSNRRYEAEKGEGSCWDTWCGKNSAFAWLTQTQLTPVIWAIIIGLVAMFVFKVVWNERRQPAPLWMKGWGCICVLFASAGLLLLYMVTSTDPGFVPRGSQRAGKPGSKPNGRAASSAGDNQYRQLDSPALWAGNWSQLCVSCKIVRPLRAKHCSVTDRCIENFDHFCPWVGNVVAKGNRHLFLMFLWVETVAMGVALMIACLRLHRLYTGEHPDSFAGPGWLIAFIVCDGFMLISVIALAVTQASQVSSNVTTNELANWQRYRYMKDAEGNFANPFDRGCRQNCTETMFPHSAESAPLILSDEKMSLLRMEQGQLSNNEPAENGA